LRATEAEGRETEARARVEAEGDSLVLSIGTCQGVRGHGVKRGDDVLALLQTFAEGMVCLPEEGARL